MASERSDKSLIKLLNSKGEATIAIFDRGDSYACYGNDAVLLANEVFKSDICVKKIRLNVPGESQIPYVYLSFGQYQRVIRELIMFLRYRVELYSLEDEEWILKAKGTVGNSADFEEIIGDVISSGSTVMAISIAGEGNNHVKVAFWDIDELRVTSTDFNDTSVFSQTEQCIVGMNPRECLLIKCDDASKKKTLTSLLKRVGVLLTDYKASKNIADEQLQLVFRGEEKLPEQTKSLLQALYLYFDMEKQPQFAQKFSLSNYQTSGYMHLDGAAVRALELFSTNYFHDESTNGTLFGILNKCKTVGGQRLLRDWIARPLCDLRLLRERQTVVSALVENSFERTRLRDTLLLRIPDVALLSRKLLQGKAKLQECYRIYEVISILGHIENALREIYEKSEAGVAIKELILEPVCYALTQFERYGELIRSTIDTDYYDKTTAFRIKPSIDPALLQIANEIEELQTQLEKARKKFCARENIDTSTIKLDCNNQWGYFYRITLKEEKNIRRNKEITVLSTTKGSGVMFRDETITNLNERYQELNKIYSQTQEELEKKVVETCAGYTVSLTQLGSTLSVIDVLASLATVASDSDYNCPILEPLGSGVLEIHACRHPVLETALGGQFIPNDVFLDRENRMIILTGANMGGKSTYLRSAALCVLMAQIGSYVPANSAKIPLIDGIFTRVGAGDQQTKGISTFMAEMLDCSSILQASTSNSLVILDEVGRGTSTFDGFGLAMAIASDLLERVRCFCLFATHFHEMADLTEKDGACAKQMTVTIEEGQLSMLYEVRPGVATSSFGLEVAKIVGFPEKVVTAAADTLRTLEEDTVNRLRKAEGEDLRSLLLSL